MAWDNLTHLKTNGDLHLSIYRTVNWAIFDLKVVFISP